MHIPSIHVHACNAKYSIRTHNKLPYVWNNAHIFVQIYIGRDYPAQLEGGGDGTMFCWFIGHAPSREHNEREKRERNEMKRKSKNTHSIAWMNTAEERARERQSKKQVEEHLERQHHLDAGRGLYFTLGLRSEGSPQIPGKCLWRLLCVKPCSYARGRSPHTNRLESERRKGGRKCKI